MATSYDKVTAAQQALDAYDAQHFPAERAPTRAALKAWEDGRAPLVRAVRTALATFAATRPANPNDWVARHDAENP